MNTKVLQYDEAEDDQKAAAAIDAKARDALFINNFTQTERNKAKAFADTVRSAYFRSRVFINYREKFIAVKVEKPQRADIISSEVTVVDDHAANKGYLRKQTKTAIIYRLPKV